MGKRPARSRIMDAIRRGCRDYDLSRRYDDWEANLHAYGDPHGVRDTVGDATDLDWLEEVEEDGTITVVPRIPAQYRPFPDWTAAARRWREPVMVRRVPGDYPVPEVLRSLLTAEDARAAAAILTEGTKHTAGPLWAYIHGDKEKPLLVCHADTVGSPVSSVEVTNGGTVWNPRGILGADDRAGMYAARLLHDLTGAAVLVCDEEEFGGGGAHQAARQAYDLLRCHPYFVELDRRGDCEAVYYSGEPPAFRRMIAAAGFAEAMGSFSDISILCPAIGKPGVNIGIGYYMQHTRQEYLEIPTLNKAIDRLSDLLRR